VGAHKAGPGLLYFGSIVGELPLPKEAQILQKAKEGINHAGKCRFIEITCWPSP
jgi:hypothetical protein